MSNKQNLWNDSRYISIKPEFLEEVTKLIAEKKLSQKSAIIIFALLGNISTGALTNVCNLTPTKLAKLTGVSTKHIYKYINEIKEQLNGYLVYANINELNNTNRFVFNPNYVKNSAYYNNVLDDVFSTKNG